MRRRWPTTTSPRTLPRCDRAVRRRPPWPTPTPVVPADAWSRRGLRSNGSEFTIASISDLPSTRHRPPRPRRQSLRRGPLRHRGGAGLARSRRGEPRHSRAGSTVSASPSPPRRGPSGASRSEARGWALTPVRPRPIPPARRDARRPGVARCRARHATRRCRGPRSPVPEPTTRSRTVRETRISPAPAWPRIRAAMCTAIPPMSVSSSSHSPVWMPARISMPSVSASARKASAQRMACVGPSNVVRWPSPVLFTTVPPNLGVRRAVISPKRWSTARHRSSPVATACSVDATMSVNNKVRKARCDCEGAAWLPVRNFSISMVIWSDRRAMARGRAIDFEVPRPGDVVGDVPAALHRNDSLAGMDDQRGRGDRRQDRPHVDPEQGFECHPRHPRACTDPSNIASWRIDRTDGSRAFPCFTAAPRRRAARPNSCQRAICCIDGV